jgi:hypothetical protein
MPRISLGRDVPRVCTEEWQPHVMEAWYVDICHHCWHDTREQNPRLIRSAVAHMPYQEQDPPLRCWLCQAALDADDNA